jgi:hypothetical protein
LVERVIEKSNRATISTMQLVVLVETFAPVFHLNTYQSHHITFSPVPEIKHLIYINN